MNSRAKRRAIRKLDALIEAVTLIHGSLASLVIGPWRIVPSEAAPEEG